MYNPTGFVLLWRIPYISDTQKYKNRTSLRWFKDHLITAWKIFLKLWLNFQFNGKNLMPNNMKKHPSIHATILVFLRMILLLLSHIDIKIQVKNEKFILVSHHHWVQDTDDTDRVDSIIELSFYWISIPLSKWTFYC